MILPSQPTLSEVETNRPFLVLPKLQIHGQNKHFKLQAFSGSL